LITFDYNFSHDAVSPKGNSMSLTEHISKDLQLFYHEEHEGHEEKTFRIFMTFMVTNIYNNASKE